METSNLKNMVVLRNLPSNIVDEAIIILKSNKKIKKLEKIERSENRERSKNKSKSSSKKEKEYYIKEAEMLVSSYISKIEDKKSKEFKTKRTNIKLERYKKFAYLSTFIILIETLMLVIR